jgi:hypothetical protein
MTKLNQPRITFTSAEDSPVPRGRAAAFEICCRKFPARNAERLGQDSSGEKVRNIVIPQHNHIPLW